MIRRKQPEAKGITDRPTIELLLAAQKKLLTTPPSDPVAERADQRLGTQAYSRELPSLAHSCHPMQVKEFNDFAASAGLTGVKYDAQGKCHFSSRGQRKAFNKLRGLVDKDGGYGD